VARDIWPYDMVLVTGALQLCNILDNPAHADFNKSTSATLNNS